ncbi:NAD(P)H-hydrate epimerase [Desulfobacterota bacterium AH_259_B03_O07]|nr:NAD(P)H-hydrate epimerase [Desulfobacterota bacterium AH_259_B03_O07]
MSVGADQKETRFFTETGIEVPAVTEEQMREVDRIAIEETGPNLFQMMENAGRNLALLAIEVLGNGWEKAKILVLAGTGGNGGGGVCAARHLANRAVKVAICLSKPEGLREVPAFQRKIYQFAGGREINLNKLSDEKFDLIVDALIGYSLRSEPHGTILDLIHWANFNNSPILSLDIPSGVDSTTGDTYGEFIKPDWTMTLALPKNGLLPKRTGKLILADIGIPIETYNRLGFDDYVSPFGRDFRIPIKYV